MLIENIVLRDFRNFSDVSFSFVDGINLILGPNGAGKTNLLEAISYLSIPKSFRGVNDRALIRWGQPLFMIDGTVRDRITTHNIRIAFNQTRKKVEVDSHPIKSYRELFSRFVTFVVSNRDHELIDGPPSFRRKRFDRFLSTFVPGYFEALLEYRNLLEHKNFILKSGPDDRVLSVINRKLIDVGNRLIEARRSFINRIALRFSEMVKDLIGVDGAIRYVPSVDALDEDIMNERLGEEIKRGFSLIGPHRDDFLIEFSAHAASEVASEGEKRLLVLSLILTIRDVWRDERGEQPVLLLDEPLSLLGDRKIEKLLQMFSGQTILTAVRDPGYTDKIITLQ